MLREGGHPVVASFEMVPRACARKRGDYWMARLRGP